MFENSVGSNHNANLAVETNFYGGASSGSSRSYSNVELRFILSSLKTAYDNVYRIYEDNSKSAGVGQITDLYEAFIEALSGSHMCSNESPYRLDASSWSSIEGNTLDQLKRLRDLSRSVSHRITNTYELLSDFLSKLDNCNYPSLQRITFGSVSEQSYGKQDISFGTSEGNPINPPESNPTQDAPSKGNSVNPPESNPTQDVPTKGESGTPTPPNSDGDGSGEGVTTPNGGGSGTGTELPDSGSNESGGQSQQGGSGANSSVVTDGDGQDLDTETKNNGKTPGSTSDEDYLGDAGLLGGATAGATVTGGLFDDDEPGSGYGNYDFGSDDYNFEDYDPSSNAYRPDNLFGDDDDYDPYGDLKHSLDDYYREDPSYEPYYPSNSDDYDNRNNPGTGSGSSSDTEPNWERWSSARDEYSPPAKQPEVDPNTNPSGGSTSGSGSSPSGEPWDSHYGEAHERDIPGVPGKTPGADPTNPNGGTGGINPDNDPSKSNPGQTGPTGGTGVNPDDGSDGSKPKPGQTGGTSDWGGDGSTGNGGTNGGYFTGSDNGDTNGNKKGNLRGLPDVTVENVGLGSVTMAGAMGAGSAAAGMAGNGSGYTNSYVGNLGGGTGTDANGSMGFAGNSEEEEKRKKAKYQFTTEEGEIENPDEQKQGKDIESVVVDTLEPTGVESLDDGANMGTILGLGGISAGLGIGGAYLSQAKKEAEEEEKKKQEKKNEETLGLVGGIIGASFISDDDDEDNKKKKKRNYFNNDINKPDDINNFMKR